MGKKEAPRNGGAAEPKVAKENKGSRSIHTITYLDTCRLLHVLHIAIGRAAASIGSFLFFCSCVKRATHTAGTFVLSFLRFYEGFKPVDYPSEHQQESAIKL